MKKPHGILRQPFYTIEKFDKPMRDYWGTRIVRPISIHRLKSSIEDIQYGQAEISPFLKDLEKALGTDGKPLRKVRIELFQEGLYQWVFLVSGSWGRSVGRTLVLLLAKDGGRLSAVAQREWSMLQVLYQRNPKLVSQPVVSTVIPVATEQGRENLFGYYTELIPDFTELGIDAEHRFYMVGIQKVERLTIRASELMRARILELLVSLYDPETGSALVDVEVNSGDFLGRIREGTIDVRLIAVRRLRTGMSTAGLLRALLRPMGEHAEAQVFLYPETPKGIIDSLMTGLRRAYKGDRDAALMALRKGLKKNVETETDIPREHLTWQMLLDTLDKMEPAPGSQPRIKDAKGSTPRKRSPKPAPVLTSESAFESPTSVPAAKPASRPAAKPASRPAAKPASRPAAKPASRPAPKPKPEPASKPAPRPASRPVSKPADRPVSRPNNRPESRSDDRPARKPASRPNNRPESRSDDRPARKPASRPNNRPDTRSDDRSARKPASRPNNRPESRSDDRPARKPASRPNNRPDTRSDDRPARKPASRPNNRPDTRSDDRPARKPASRPNNRPDSRSDDRPARKPASRPNDRPDSRSDDKPARKPRSKPGSKPPRKS